MSIRQFPAPENRADATALQITASYHSHARKSHDTMSANTDIMTTKSLPLRFLMPHPPTYKASGGTVFGYIWFSISRQRKQANGRNRTGRKMPVRSEQALFFQENTDGKKMMRSIFYRTPHKNIFWCAPKFIFSPHSVH